MTSTPRMKINPAVLTWAREWFNMSTQHLAKKMGTKSITEDTIKAWETGEKQPTYAQLEKLSQILEKPLEVFLYSDIPQIPKPSAAYRSVYGDYSKELPTEILKIIAHTKNFQTNLKELTNGINPAETKITEYKYTSSLLEKTLQVRKILNITLEEQKTFGTYPKGFEIWRNTFANVGIYIVKEPFGITTYSGFCLVDKEFPVICVNNTMSYQRQIFTLFHELYHLINNANGVDITDKNEVLPRFKEETQSLERSCDEFAAEFLVPTQDFLNETNKISDITQLMENGTYTEIINNCVAPMAKMYCVSRDVIFRKLQETKFLSPNQSYQLSRKHLSDNLRESEKSGGGNYFSNQVCYLGRPYINLVMESQEKYKISEYEAAEYLHTNVKNLPQLLDAAMKGGN